MLFAEEVCMWFQSTWTALTQTDFYFEGRVLFLFSPSLIWISFQKKSTKVDDPSLTWVFTPENGINIVKILTTKSLLAFYSIKQCSCWQRQQEIEGWRWNISKQNSFSWGHCHLNKTERLKKERKSFRWNLEIIAEKFEAAASLCKFEEN